MSNKVNIEMDNFILKYKQYFLKQIIRYQDMHMAMKASLFHIISQFDPVLPFWRIYFDYGNENK